MHELQVNSLMNPGHIGPRWTVEGFSRFWENPNLSLVSLVVTTDVSGYWPRAPKAVRGREAYTRAIGELLSLVPDFHGRALEHCGDGSRIFVRWEAEAKVPIGPNLITGVDRILLRDGLVSENRIYSDHPLFELLATRLQTSELRQK